jgi:hypothetical protein
MTIRLSSDPHPIREAPAHTGASPVQSEAHCREADMVRLEYITGKLSIAEACVAQFTSQTGETKRDVAMRKKVDEYATKLGLLEIKVAQPLRATVTTTR